MFVVEELFEVFVGTVDGDVVFEEVATSPTPNWAKGFGLPVVASGTSTILESCKLVKAWSEKIESSNFIVLTLNNNVRKFPETEEAPSKVFVFIPEPSATGNVVVVLEEETKLGWLEEDGFIRNK